MDFSPESTQKKELDQIAEASGLAIAVVDSASSQLTVSNNNSICRSLNPNGDFTGQCRAFCGTAFEEAKEVGSTVAFTCHAGLECRVVPFRNYAAIVGRTFLSVENYRKATGRSVSGDWREIAPTSLFENVLMGGSAESIEKTAVSVETLLRPIDAAPETVPPEAEQFSETPVQLEETPPQAPPVIPEKPQQQPKKGSEEISNLVARFNEEMGLTTKPAKPEIKPPAAVVPAEKQPPVENIVSTPAFTERRSTEAGAWRSLFGSLLKNNYDGATRSVLEFLSAQYDFAGLIWLDRRNGALENTAAVGSMKGRKIKLGIAADDQRIVNALKNETSLELGEHSTESTPSRTMHLFPIGLAGDISAAIAIVDDEIANPIKQQIARICRSLAPQLEILRLREEIARGETLSMTVRRFGESLKHIDADDFWQSLTRTAAEMLRAERASLMTFDTKSELLEIKAIIGALRFRTKREDIGERVAKAVYANRKAVVAADIAQTGLAPVTDRGYKTDSFLSCPINIGSRCVGVMNFTDKASGSTFDRASLDLFLSVAPQLAVAIDRASLKEKAGEFEQLSVTDALTGLLNRRYMEQRLDEETKRSNRHGYPMSFMMLDVDHFKSFNDQFGHPAGDEALKLVGQVIKDTLRSADVAARFGGEEFSILLPQTTGDEAGAIAERIRTNIEETDFHHRRVTISIGIASCSAELCSSTDLVSAADKALYRAKHEGRNRVVAFEQMEAK